MNQFQEHLKVCLVSFKTQIFLNINDKKLTKSKKNIFNYFYNNSKNYKILNFKLKKNTKKLLILI